MGIKKLQIKESATEIQVGCGLSLQDWADLVHPESDGYVTVATKNSAGEWTEKSYPTGVWLQKLVRHKDLSCYVSVNSFFIPKRSNDNARHINAFYVDLDHYKESLSQDEVLNALDFLTRTERLPEPSMVIDSGRGLYGMWLIESVPAKFKSVQKLYSYIEKHLIDVLKELGSDAQASDVARVLKAPSTYHHVTGKMVEVLRYNKKHYTMRFMQQWFNESSGTDYDAEKIAKRTPKPKKKKSKKKLTNLFNAYTLAIARAEDLTKICEMRNFEMDGYRNTLLHIYTYQMFLIHNNYHIVRNKVVELNDKLTEPKPTFVLVEILRTCLKAYENHREDVSKGYNYRNERIIKELEITPEEQRHLKTIIGKIEKYARNNKRRKEERREGGLTSRERAKQEKVTQVLVLREKGLKQAEIAEKVGVSTRYVKKILNGK